MKTKDQILIFLGKKDTLELRGLAELARRKGFITGTTTSSVRAEISRRISSAQQPLEVRVAGGYAGSCIAQLIQECLEYPTSRISKVRVDLHDIRFTSEGTGQADNDPRKLWLRSRELTGSLGRFAQDPRLEITPQVR